MEERKPPDLMHSAAIHLLRRVARVDDESGIGPARLSVLVYRGVLTLSELADAERVTAPTMTRVVDGLERDSLARREPHPEDGRSVRVVVTARGHRLFQHARPCRGDRRASALDTRAEPRVTVWLQGDVRAGRGRGSRLPLDYVGERHSAPLLERVAEQEAQQHSV